MPTSNGRQEDCLTSNSRVSKLVRADIGHWDHGRTVRFQVYGNRITKEFAEQALTIASQYVENDKEYVVQLTADGYIFYDYMNGLRLP